MQGRERGTPPIPGCISATYTDKHVVTFPDVDFQVTFGSYVFKGHRIGRGHRFAWYADFKFNGGGGGGALAL